ncbi:hypothetical protein OA79_04090 [Marinomonas sp. TW1]|nr:hypothetical protein OA79_04090 [Marinomonas sp. TW1]
MLLNEKRGNEQLNCCQFDAIRIARPYGLPKSVTEDLSPTIITAQHLTIFNPVQTLATSESNEPL